MTTWLLSPLVSVVHVKKIKKPTAGISVLGTQLLAVTQISSPDETAVSVCEFRHGCGAMCNPLGDNVSE